MDLLPISSNFWVYKYLTIRPEKKYKRSRHIGRLFGLISSFYVCKQLVQRCPNHQLQILSFTYRKTKKQLLRLVFYLSLAGEPFTPQHEISIINGRVPSQSLPPPLGAGCMPCMEEIVSRWERERELANITEAKCNNSIAPEGGGGEGWWWRETRRKENTYSKYSVYLPTKTIIKIPALQYRLHPPHKPADTKTFFKWYFDIRMQEVTRSYITQKKPEQLVLSFSTV